MRMRTANMAAIAALLLVMAPVGAGWIAPWTTAARTACRSPPLAMRGATLPKEDATLLLPRGADEATLKRRFKKLAAIMHPDKRGEDAEAVAQFQALTEEYAQRRQECRSAAARDELEKAWLAVGGMAAAATLVYTTSPIVPASVFAAVKGANMIASIPAGLEKQAAQTSAAAAAAEVVEAKTEQARTAAYEAAAWESRYAKAYREMADTKADDAAQAAEEAAHLKKCSIDAERERRRKVGWRSLPLRSSLPFRKHRRKEFKHTVALTVAQASSAAMHASEARTRAKARRVEAEEAQSLAQQTTEAAEAAEAIAVERAEEAEAARGVGDERRQDAAKAATTAADYHAVVGSLGGLGEAVGGAAGDLLAGAVVGAVAGVEKVVKRWVDPEAAARGERGADD